MRSLVTTTLSRKYILLPRRDGRMPQSIVWGITYCGMLETTLRSSIDNFLLKRVNWREKPRVIYSRKVLELLVLSKWPYSGEGMFPYQGTTGKLLLRAFAD